MEKISGQRRTGTLLRCSAMWLFPHPTSSANGKVLQKHHKISQVGQILQCMVKTTDHNFLTVSFVINK